MKKNIIWIAIVAIAIFVAYKFKDKLPFLKNLFSKKLNQNSSGGANPQNIPPVGNNSSN